jgi:hypothetical protein
MPYFLFLFNTPLSLPPQYNLSVYLHTYLGLLGSFSQQAFPNSGVLTSSSNRSNFAGVTMRITGSQTYSGKVTASGIPPGHLQPHYYPQNLTSIPYLRTCLRFQVFSLRNPNRNPHSRSLGHSATISTPTSHC